MRRARRSTLATLAIGLAVSLLVLAATSAGLFRPVEGLAVDWMQRLAGEREIDPRVVVCAIDRESIDRFGRWPWRRGRMADLIDRLDAAGARAIALDVVFSEPSTCGGACDVSAEDLALATAIERAGTVVLSYFFEPQVSRVEPLQVAADPRFQPTAPEELLPYAFERVSGRVEELPFPDYPAVEPNLRLFTEAAASQGFTTNQRDAGVSRRQALAARFADGIYPAFPLRAVAQLTGGELELRVTAGGRPSITVGGRQVEIDSKGQLWVHYPGGEGRFRMVSARAVLEDDPATFAPLVAGSLVFVGATETGIGDVTATPFGVELPGVLVHAAVADNLLTGRFLKESGAPRAISVLALLLMGPLVAFLVAAVERHLVGSLVAIGLVLLWPVVAFAAFARFGWHLETVGPVAAGVIALVPTLRYQVKAVDARARQIRRTFERFVSQAIVDEMLRNPERVALGGERREMTVLFSDIRGFTTLAESLDSEAVVALLNRFFTPMTRLILAGGGTLDKYMGDALMAFFGAPVALPDHAARACRAALGMRVRLAELNEEWRAEGRLPEGAALGIGIGLNSGDMSVGNMGSEDVFDYTVIGDNVNLGSRIEGINKLYGTEILVSEATAEQAGDGFLFRELDRVRVKGKTAPVGLFELLAERPAPPELEERARRFAEALAGYRERRFREAAEEFRILSGEGREGGAGGADGAEGDPTAAVLAARCERLAAEGAPDDWEPVETLTSK